MDPRCCRVLYQVVEAIALRQASGAAVSGSLRDNTFVGLAFPSAFSPTTETVRQLSCTTIVLPYEVNHVKSSLYYPRGMARLKLPIDYYNSYPDGL